MPLVRPFQGVVPSIAPGAWLAPGSVVIGDVELGPDASVWYGSVLRGDVHSIRVGARSNIQDLSVVHVTRDRFACTIGEEVTVGHHATVHGCTIERGALIGIGAIVLDGATVGEAAMVAAGSLVPPGFDVPPGVLVLGSPARVIRDLREEEVARNRRNTLAYVDNARAHAQEVAG